MNVMKSFSLIVLVAVLGSYSYVNADDISGVWTKKEQTIRGTWSVDVRDDGHYLVLSENFRTRNAPDLKFVLSMKPLSELTSKNAMSGGVVIGSLKSNRGAQSYKLPENYSGYSSLLLHCEEYSKLWGASSLE